MNLMHQWKQRRRGGLLENTIMLYILQFSLMALGVVNRGIQTRAIDDKTMLGTLTLAQSIMMYFQLLMDFGFIASATAKISKHREDRAYLCKILSCVTVIKLVFLVVSALILLVVLFFMNNLSPMDWVVFFLFLMASALSSLLPDYLYRGMEQMTTITVRAVSVKVFATVMLFLFVHQSEDYYLVPLFTAIGNGGALIFVYAHLFKKMNIRFTRVKLSDLFHEMKESFGFFVSRIASTVYSSANVQVLGFVDPTKALGAVYGSADTLISTGRNCMTPISDSLYPHMVKHRDFKLIRKALLFFMPIIIVGCVGVFFLAEPICVLLYGPAYAESAVPLRALLPALLVTLPSYLLGFPTMSPMGLAKYANYTTIVGTVFHVVGLVVLVAVGGLHMVSLCLLTGATETVILLCRIGIIWKNRHLMKAEPASATAEPEKTEQ